MPTSINKEERSLVPSLDRALSILEYMEKHGACTLTRLSNDLCFPKTSVHQILKVLARRGYIRDNGSKAYKLGLKFFELGNNVLQEIDIRDEASPYLHELMRETKMTCHLAIRNGNEAIYIAKIMFQHSSVVNSWVGKRLSLYTTALGRCLMAWEDAEEIDNLLANFPIKKATEKSLSTPEEYLAILEKTRANGWAEECGENRIGVQCVAAPIRDITKKVIAAISVSGLSAEINETLHLKIARLVKRTGERLSSALGYTL